MHIFKESGVLSVGLSHWKEGYAWCQGGFERSWRPRGPLAGIDAEDKSTNLSRTQHERDYKVLANTNMFNALCLNLSHTREGKLTSSKIHDWHKMFQVWHELTYCSQSPFMVCAMALRILTFL